MIITKNESLALINEFSHFHDFLIFTQSLLTHRIKSNLKLIPKFLIFLLLLLFFFIASAFIIIFRAILELWHWEHAAFRCHFHHEVHYELEDHWDEIERFLEQVNELVAFWFDRWGRFTGCWGLFFNDHHCFGGIFYF